MLFGSFGSNIQSLSIGTSSPLSMCQKAPAVLDAHSWARPTRALDCGLVTPETSLPMENPRTSPLRFDQNLRGLLAVTKEDYTEGSWRGFALAREKVHLHGGGSQPCSDVLRWRGSLQSCCNFRSRRHLSSCHKLSLIKGRTGTLQLWFTPWGCSR